MSEASPAPSRPAVRPLPVRRAIAGLGTSLGIGAALGALAWLADWLGYPVGSLIPSNAIGAWVAVAFVLGASARTIPTGALRGLLGLLTAVAVYYVLTAATSEGFRAIGASHAATVWGAVVLVAGPALGGAGSVWRYRIGWPRAIAVALLAAALIAEGLAFGLTRLSRLDQLTADPGAFLLAAEIAIGAALPWLLLRRGERMRGYLSTIALAAIAVLVVGPFTALVRGVADRF